MSTTCPDCQAPLTGSPTCPACDLPLTGPMAAQLWNVDQRLVALEGEQERLLANRAHLLQLLRSGEPDPPVVPPVFPAPFKAPLRRESSPAQVQNTLLGLGALLLAVAFTVFAAVTYDLLGVAGRAAVLLVLTALAALAPSRLRARNLKASAEAVAAVALALAALDAWALRRAGLADGIDGRSYAAVASGLFAAAAGGWATRVPLRSARLTAVLAGQLPVLLVLARIEASLPAVAVTLACLAAVDLALLVPRLPFDVRAALTGCAAGTLGVSLVASLAAIEDGDAGGALGLVAVAAVLAGLSVRVTGLARARFSGAAVPLLAAAAWGAVEPQLTDPQRPLVLIAVALATLQLTALLPRARRDGPAAGALLVAAGAVLAQAGPVLMALFGPFTWITEAWSLHATSARQALVPTESWHGTVVTLVVLLGAAVAAVAGGLALDRVRPSLLPAAALVAVAGPVLPLGLATSYDVALALLLALGTACTAAGLQLLNRRRPVGLALVGVAAGLVAEATLWSLADRPATLVVLPVATALAVAVAVPLRGAATAVAVLLAGGWLAANGAAQDLAQEQVGGLLLVAVVAALGLSTVVRGTHRIAAEGAAAALATIAVALTTEDPGWLSWTLALSGLLCLAVALRPDRREVATAGGLLLSASSWVRLADAGVHAPEPYVLPLAVVALVLGHLRRRSLPATTSWAAYGPGLLLALVPSLLASLDDDVPLRGVLLLPAAALVVVAGVQERLRAPLLIGGSVLAVDALHLLAPYAAALPRWLLLALVGGTLIGLGVTYEQRRRDVARLRLHYEAFT